MEPKVPKEDTEPDKKQDELLPSAAESDDDSTSSSSASSTPAQDTLDELEALITEAGLSRPKRGGNVIEDDDDDGEGRPSTTNAEKPTTAGELKLSDLPPIEDLTISVPVNELVKIGKVISIVDVLVVVESIKSMPPLDLDTVLFKEDGTTIGQVFDTFGTVTEPHYSVRFTNSEQIKAKGVEMGQDILFSPQTDRVITKFAFVDELKKIKGTDASWEHDNEIPPNVDAGEFSDDEQEKQARRRRR